MTVSAVLRRSDPATGDGVNLNFPFVFLTFNEDEVAVFVRDAVTEVETQAVYLTDYTVTLNGDQDANPGGTVIFTVAPASGDTVVITSALPYEQQTALPDGGQYRAQTVERALDVLSIQIQQLAESLSRSVQVQATDAGGVQDLLADVNALAANLAELQIAVNNISSILTVAGIEVEVTGVAGVAPEVAAVAAIAPQVTTVAGISADVTAVAADAADIGTVAGSIANVNTVAGNTTNIDTVAGIDTDVTALAAVAADVAALADEIPNFTSFAKLAVDQTFTGANRGTVTTDNDLSFDLTATNNFACAPTGTGTLTFTNIASAAGQSGLIRLDNSGAHAISAAATTKVSASFLAAVSTAGVYLLTYFCDGTNVFVVASEALA